MSSKTEESTLVAMSGSPILRHADATPFTAPQASGCIEQIANHIAAHLGQVESVFHEIISDTVHIDVHIVKPNARCPGIRLVTSGMSDLPMSTPQRVGAPQYMELLATLPPAWHLDQESLQDERWYWPIRLLKVLARLPHKYQTWLGFGHTVPNGDPCQPYAPNTKLCGAIILPSITVPARFHRLRIDASKEISFFCVVPLYEEEMNLKLRLGSEALLKRLEKAKVNDLIEPARPNAAR